MSFKRPSRALSRLVADRAHWRCEYCQSPAIGLTRITIYPHTVHVRGAVRGFTAGDRWLIDNLSLTGVYPPVNEPQREERRKATLTGQVLPTSHNVSDTVALRWSQDVDADQSSSCNPVMSAKSR